IKEVKRHSYYLKPGAKRRVKQALARQRAEKDTKRAGLSCRHFVRCCRFRSSGRGSMLDNDACGFGSENIRRSLSHCKVSVTLEPTDRPPVRSRLRKAI